jgi:hypothetical protein
MHRAHPDHAGFAPLLSDAVGVAHIGCPHAPMRVETLPGGRLNCDRVGHGSFAC